MYFKTNWYFFFLRKKIIGIYLGLKKKKNHYRMYCYYHIDLVTVAAQIQSNSLLNVLGFCFRSSPCCFSSLFTPLYNGCPCIGVVRVLGDPLPNDPSVRSDRHGAQCIISSFFEQI